MAGHELSRVRQGRWRGGERKGWGMLAMTYWLRTVWVIAL